MLEVYAGLNETGVPVRGGDTSAAENHVYLSVTAVGRSERVPGRSGARPGDLLLVTGPLGGSAAGLRALEEGLAGHDDLVLMHSRPPLRLEEGRRLARVAHAQIDLSDGLAADAASPIAERSGVGIEIEVERLPLAPGIDAVGDEPFWTMGEDYELLASLSPGDAADARLSRSSAAARRAPAWSRTSAVGTRSGFLSTLVHPGLLGG